jgi:hypothetical protein
VQGIFFDANQKSLCNEHQTPQNQGNAVGMHPVIFLFKKSAEIGKPEPSQNQEKKCNEVEVAFLEQVVFEFHVVVIDSAYNAHCNVEWLRLRKI